MAASAHLMAMCAECAHSLEFRPHSPATLRHSRRDCGPPLQSLSGPAGTAGAANSAPNKYQRTVRASAHRATAPEVTERRRAKCGPTAMAYDFDRTLWPKCRIQWLPPSTVVGSRGLSGRPRMYNSPASHYQSPAVTTSPARGTRACDSCCDSWSHGSEWSPVLQ
jgi:hypothetical protein